MVFEIVQAGDPVLRRPAAPVPSDQIATPFVQELIASMRQTMYDAPGVGLAAPQVGESLQVVVMEDDGPWLDAMSEARLADLRRRPLPLTVLVNPSLEPIGDETDEFFEGCLSVEGYSAVVPRHRAVRVHGLDGDGERLELELEGWPARIAQHELDHLAGVLYVDRMDTRTFTTSENAGRWYKARSIPDVRQRITASAPAPWHAAPEA